MISKYVNGQASIYNTIVNQCVNNRLSHAYLVDANDNEDAVNIIKDFSKYLICPNRCIDKCCNIGCDICKNIDNLSCDEFRIIDTDSLWIKKEQILELQRDFSKKSSIGLKKIYIITEAAKLNGSSANTLLKFLEEPDDNILAFLITNNINLVLDTIKSRCQFVKLSNMNLQSIDNFKNIDKVLEFIDCLENMGSKCIIYDKDRWLNYFANRNACFDALSVMVCIYDLILKYKIGYVSSINLKCSDSLIKISNTNSLDVLIKKILSLVNSCDDIKKNVNINLLLDNLIFSFGGD